MPCVIWNMDCISWDRTATGGMVSVVLACNKLLFTHLTLVSPNSSMNRVSIGSNKGLSPIRRQAIILCSAVLLSIIGPLGANFSEISMHLKMSSAKWRLFCPGGNELIQALCPSQDIGILASLMSRNINASCPSISRTRGYSHTSHIWTWASYQIRKIAGCACAGNAGNNFPRRRFQKKPLVSDSGMHHGTCVTHVPWCMSGSLTCGDGENVPGIPGACAPAILRIWQEAHASD